MDEIFANAKSILIVWFDSAKTENLLPFKEKIQMKAKQAEISFENAHMLNESKRQSSSFDIIIYGLIIEQDIWPSIELLNELFRLLKPNSYIITHIAQDKEVNALDRFKMCGFVNCNKLDNNSSFLMELKDYSTRQLGSLWLCQKPSFDIGYSVPLKNIKQSQKQVPSSKPNNVWKINANDDDDDLIDTDALLDEEDRKKPDIKNYDCGTASNGVRKACKNCTCGLAQELEKSEYDSAAKNVKSSCGSCYLGDAFRCAGCPYRGLPPFQPGERINIPTMSDV
ncbi:unnamed protein product [Didymodactylos carnosus]|uniref:Anamorsin homolog n=1 Tax=Didymodactylos carnosus TaxID=1234261 RepID=A0A814CCF0_9BILA|nr:unnamed protein product [Didymodactylos carnosus]CAF1004998.1 unnamed protein product [Didymodactylos carnosus]CAF3715791.1 unnamed protein product [Didymodactylos carnosus]CAF3774252.1 unnamed protein product [Didymodactylos carnosus]